MDSLPPQMTIEQFSAIAPVTNKQFLGAKTGRTATVALVDGLGLSRDCLMTSLLTTFGKEITIKSFASIENMMSIDAAGFDLLLLYIHHQAAENFHATIEALINIPLPILLITDDKVTDLRRLFGDPSRARICGLVSAIDCDSKLLSAAVRFVLSGGTFLPLEMILSDFDPPTKSFPPKKASSGLTPRQSDVFAKLQQGKSNKLIAHELGMSASTAKVHICSIMRTIGATNRTQAVLMGQSRFGFNTMPQNATNT